MNKFVFSVIALVFAAIGFKFANEKLEAKPPEISQIKENQSLQGKSNLIEQAKFEDINRLLSQTNLNTNSKSEVETNINKDALTSVSKKSEITKDSKVDILTKKDTSIKVATLRPKQTKPISTRARLKTNPDLTIYFDEAKSEINNFELSKLEKIIQKNPSKNIYLKAHNDSLGTKASNKKLSEERIASIKNLLDSKGLKVAIEAEIDGGKNSLESNKTAIGRANNRRIEIFLED